MRQPTSVGSSITTRGGDAKVHGRLLPGAPIEPAKLLFGVGQADLETFDLAEPAFRLAFARACDLARSFTDLVRDRRGQLLFDWIRQAEQSGLILVGKLAPFLPQDLDAVTAGLTLEWSSGFRYLTFPVVRTAISPVPPHQHWTSSYPAGDLLHPHNQAQPVDSRVSARPV
ncbi:hypothetical protein ACFVX2_31585 [Streptomyces sp. NPDC058283]|uniref:hypothetical protein n=1 Tax=Streptomyces sp. NPDC058283 TaxID=3346420 RepID=UPI0036EFEB25